ncbi:anti-sigma factor [Catellatospora citrea]|uniref:anti-sigma factor n=1 Tax=Catellatospora citrea TaxID=53366 RepID=UPI0033C43FC9
MSETHCLAGPYVLHALDEPEQATFEQHLRGCVTCAVEVAEFGETVARLAEDTWSAPPPELRGRVLAQTRLTRQLPPARPVRGRRALTRWWRHPALATAAACLLVAALAAGVTFTVQQQRLRDERASAQFQLAHVHAVLSAPDAQLRAADVAGGGRVTVVASAGRDSAVLMLAAPDPGAGRAYQFWLMNGGTPHSAGVLNGGQGTATCVISGLRAAEALAVSVEPVGGSPAPTLPIAAQVAIR